MENEAAWIEENEAAWIQEQNALKQRLITTDAFPWSLPERFGHGTLAKEVEEIDSRPEREGEAVREVELEGLKLEDSDGSKKTELKYIGGMDISFVKEDETLACAALVVVDAATMDPVYEDLEMVTLDMPYIAGFLAFRESPALITLLNKMRASRPDVFPDLLMIDGNGVLHPRGFGLASHVGVVADIPTLGIAKTLFEVDGLRERDVKRSARRRLLSGGDAMNLVGRSGKVWGSALRSTGDCLNPVFVSVGHKVSLQTGVEIVRRCCKFRVPEPVRLADKRSREFLRVNGYTS